MIKLFSWLLTFAIALYFISIFIVPFFSESLLPFFLIASIIIGAISFIALLIVLINERIKDKKEEDNNNDLSKY